MYPPLVWWLLDLPWQAGGRLCLWPGHQMQVTASCTSAPAFSEFTGIALFSCRDGWSLSCLGCNCQQMLSVWRQVDSFHTFSFSHWRISAYLFIHSLKVLRGLQVLVEINMRIQDVQEKIVFHQVCFGEIGGFLCITKGGGYWQGQNKPVYMYFMCISYTYTHIYVCACIFCTLWLTSSLSHFSLMFSKPRNYVVGWLFTSPPRSFC